METLRERFRNVWVGTGTEAEYQDALREIVNDARSVVRRAEGARGPSSHQRVVEEAGAIKKEAHRTLLVRRVISSPSSPAAKGRNLRRLGCM